MISVSNQFKEDIYNDNRNFYVTGTCVLSDGTQLTLKKEDFTQDNNSFIQSSDITTFPIGVALEKTAQICLINDEDQFSEYSFTGALFYLVLNLDLTTGQTEQVKLGKYRVSERPTTSELINITLVDDMVLAEVPYTTSLVFPTTLGEILYEACTNCGLVLGDTVFNNSDLTIYVPPKSTTCRDIIAGVAMIAGGNAVIDEDNYVRIKTFDTSVQTVGDILDGGYYDDLAEDRYQSGATLDGGSFGGIESVPINVNESFSNPAIEQEFYSQFFVGDLTDGDRFDIAGYVTLYIDSADTSYSKYSSSAILMYYNGTFSSTIIWYRSGDSVSFALYLSATYDSAANKVNLTFRYISSSNLLFKAVLHMATEVEYTDTDSAEYDGGSTLGNNYHFFYSMSKLEYGFDYAKATGVQVTYKPRSVDDEEQQEITYYQGEDGYVIDLSENPVLETDGNNYSEYTHDGSYGANLLQTVCQYVWNAIKNVSFRPFSLSHIAYPLASFLDPCYFIDAKGKIFFSYVTDVEFIFNAATEIANNIAVEQDTVNSYSGNSAQIAEAIATTTTEVENYQTEIQHLGETATNSTRYYETVDVDGNSVITYIHNNPELHQSSIIYKLCNEGIFISHDGGQTWIAGIDNAGNAVTNTTVTGKLMTSYLDLDYMSFNKLHDGYIRRGVMQDVDSGDNVDYKYMADSIEITDNSYGFHIKENKGFGISIDQPIQYVGPGGDDLVDAEKRYIIYYDPNKAYHHTTTNEILTRYRQQHASSSFIVDTDNDPYITIALDTIDVGACIDMHNNIISNALFENAVFIGENFIFDPNKWLGDGVDFTGYVKGTPFYGMQEGGHFNMYNIHSWFYAYRSLFWQLRGKNIIGVSDSKYSGYNPLQLTSVKLQDPAADTLTDRGGWQYWGYTGVMTISGKMQLEDSATNSSFSKLLFVNGLLVGMS